MYDDVVLGSKLTLLFGHVALCLSDIVIGRHLSSALEGKGIH